VASAWRSSSSVQLLTNHEAPERIGHVDGARLVRDHLLVRNAMRAAASLGSASASSKASVCRSGTAENRGERLQRDSGDVDLRLLAR